MQTNSKQPHPDVKGAALAGGVMLVLGVLLIIARQLVWGLVTLAIGAALAVAILRRQPKQPLTDRAAITAAETKNQFQPLPWEPVASAKDAAALLTAKLGDQGWRTVSGTLAIAAPLKFVVENTAGEQYEVFATGEFAPIREAGDAE